MNQSNEELMTDLDARSATLSDPTYAPLTVEAIQTDVHYVVNNNVYENSAYQTHHTSLAFENDVERQPTTAGGISTERGTSTPPRNFSLRLNPGTCAKGLSWWLRLELIECAVHFTFATWFMFTCLRLPPSEIRERLTGWLTMAVALSGSRCILLTMLAEELRWIITLQSHYDIRANFVTVLQSSKLSMSRWLHIMVVVWWCLSYQLLHLYEKYKELMKPLSNGQPMLPYSFTSQRSGGRPLLSLTGTEEDLLHLLSVVATVTLYSLFVYAIIFSFYGVFFLLRGVTPFGRLIQIFTPSGFTRLPQFMHVHQRNLSIPPDILQTFPTFRWKQEWKSESQENLANSSASNMCLVCLQQYQSAELLRLLPCGHAFHEECIDQWLSTHVMCPLRCSVDLNQRFCGDFAASASIISRSLPESALVHLRQHNPSLNIPIIV